MPSERGGTELKIPLRGGTELKMPLRGGTELKIPLRGGRELKIPLQDGVLTAYLGVPASGHGRGVLVLHEAWGLVDHVRDVCDRLSREGFVALAPDLYDGETADDIEAARRRVGALDAERVAAQIEGGVAALLNHHAVDGARVAAIGFCMGGHLALFAATCSRRVGAVVDFYGAPGRVDVDLARLEVPVLGIFAERDAIVPTEWVEKLRTRLDAAGERSAVHVQPGVGHAFMNDTRPDRYDAAAAVEGWDRMLAFLRAELP